VEASIGAGTVLVPREDDELDVLWIDVLWIDVLLIDVLFMIPSQGTCRVCWESGAATAADLAKMSQEILQGRFGCEGLDAHPRDRTTR
jgi:hypothetical protein